MNEHQFLKGLDISFVNEIETEGGKYYENNQEVDVIELIKKSGVNSIRLRIWNDPVAGYCNLQETVKMAKRIKDLGLHLLLDFHYSDYWADPGKQFKPKKWEQYSFPELVAAVHSFTKHTLQTLKNENALPDMVQVGNEIINGMLWEEGRVKIGDQQYDTDQQWSQLCELVKAGLAGVEAVADSENLIETMIHIDRGGDNEASRIFYDKMEAYNVSFDVIGLSFYPWWHGTLSDLENNLNDLAERYGKDIVVVEIAYPWMLPTEQKENFVVISEDQLTEGYPATVEGQSNYLHDVLKIIKKTSNNHGRGAYWWESCWIPSKQEWSVGHINNWSNLTLFDFGGNKLESLEVFKKI